MADQDWFDDEEKEMDSVTLKEFEELIAAAYAHKRDMEVIEETLKVASLKMEKFKLKLTAYLTHFNKDNYRSASGLIVKSRHLSVRVEDKAKFAEFLKEKGIYDDFVTFNNQKVVGLCNEEIEAAAREGKEYEVPGVTKPDYIERVSFRK